MQIYRMADIIPLLPISYPPQGRSSYYVPCPNCDHNGKSRDKHLNINLIKDVFRCPKCGTHGGVFDLYAEFTGTARKDVRKELVRAFSSGEVNTQLTSRPAIIIPPETEKPPAADIEIRNAAYTALLELLTLAPDHLRNLTERGLSEAAIRDCGYKTTPIIGEKLLAKRITEAGIPLHGVPGFYRDKSEAWTFVTLRRGILIPVRDICGRIQGMQIRCDNVSRRKYRWLSSGDVTGGTDGCGAEGWIHVAAPASESVILIEGPLKADIVHHLTGKTVIAVPGVNSLKHLETTLTELRELGTTTIMTAFDMDFLQNPHVQNGYNELTKLLGKMGVHYGTYLWHPDYNGLDDYVKEFCREKV